MGKNTRMLIAAVVLIAGCKSHAPKKGTAGELCIAENKPEHLIEHKDQSNTEDHVPDGPVDGRLEVAVYDQRITLPNAEKLVKDVGGLAVTMFKDGKKTESVRLDFAKRNTDKLCLYFRPAAPHVHEGWKLDTGDHPRCHCWGAPAAGSGGSAAGSGAPAGSGSAAAPAAAPAGSGSAGSAGSAK